MVDETGEQAFSWDRRLSEEDLLTPRGRSEPRGSAEQPVVVVPPSLPTMSPTQSLREEAPAVAPAVPAGILENLDRQSILDWLNRTQADGSAPGTVHPDNQGTEDQVVVEDGEILEEPAGSQDSPSLVDHSEDSASRRSSVNSDYYPGLDRFKGPNLSDSSGSSDSDTDDVESEDEVPADPSLGGDNEELPLRIDEDAGVAPLLDNVQPVDQPQVRAEALFVPPPMEEEVPASGEDDSLEDEAGQAGYILTEEEKALGIQTFRVTPRPAREWRVLAYPWAMEGESDEGHKGVKHQASGLFFPEALYHIQSRGVEDLICASSMGKKSPLFMRALSSLPLPRISDREKEIRRKARISGEVLDLVMADGSFSKALGWSALTDFSGVELDHVTEHLTDVFKNQSSPPRYHSASFAFKGIVHPKFLKFSKKIFLLKMMYQHVAEGVVEY